MFRLPSVVFIVVSFKLVVPKEFNIPLTDKLVVLLSAVVPVNANILFHGCSIVPNVCSTECGISEESSAALILK